jgi:hypothetical protein
MKTYIYFHYLPDFVEPTMDVAYHCRAHNIVEADMLADAAGIKPCSLNCRMVDCEIEIIPLEEYLPTHLFAVDNNY